MRTAVVGFTAVVLLVGAPSLSRAEDKMSTPAQHAVSGNPSVGKTPDMAPDPMDTSPTGETLFPDLPESMPDESEPSWTDSPENSAIGTVDTGADESQPADAEKGLGASDAASPKHAP